MNSQQQAAIEERLRTVEKLVCDVGKTVISMVDRLSGVEAALVSVRKDEQLYETLSELAVDVRKLLPKLQSSVEYVEAFKETHPVVEFQRQNFVNVQENKNPGFGLLGPSPYGIWGAPSPTMNWVAANGVNGLHQNGSKGFVNVKSVDNKNSICKTEPTGSKQNGTNAAQKCTRMCLKNLHSCDHDISTSTGPCPPCTKIVPKVYSCGHASDTPCFGLDKVRCFLCATAGGELKQKSNGMQHVESAPVLTDEEKIGAMRRIINDMKLKNINQCKVVIAELMMTHKNNLEAIASIFCQKVLQECSDAPDPTRVTMFFVKIISELCKFIQNDSAHQFTTEIKCFMLRVFDSILNLKKDQNNFIAVTVNKKLQTLDDESRRDLIFNLISQLYLNGIFTVFEMKDNVLQPVFGNVKLLQRAAELVLVCSARIKTDIENASDKVKATDLTRWFENFINFLADSSMQVPKDERERLTACMEILSTTWKRSGTKTPLPIIKKDELADEITFESVDIDAKRQRLLSGSSSSTSGPGSTGPKYSVPISETREFFEKYHSQAATKKKTRVEFLRKYFLRKDESYMGVFVRTLSHHVLELDNKSKVEYMGELLSLMIEAGIVSKDRVVKSFAEGVMWNFCKPDVDKEKLEADVTSVAIVLFNAFKFCSSDLAWIDSVGLPLQNNFTETWKLFCKQVLSLLRWRFPTENRVKMFLKNTTGPSKEKLKVEVDVFCRTETEKKKESDTTATII